MSESVILDAEKGEAKVRLGDSYQRTMLIRPEAFVKMLEALNFLGSAGFTLFFLIGHEKGRCDVLREAETLRHQGSSFTKRQLLDNIVYQLRVTGWGSPRIQNYDELRGVLTILMENNPLIIVSETGEKASGSICHYFRGYWVGAVSEILERNVNCLEIKCMNMGDRYCEFKVVPQ